MNNRYILFLLCAAALAYACGPWTHSQSAPGATSAYHHKTPREVATTFHIFSDGQRIQMAIQVTNNTAKSVELRFPSGMTHDFVVQDSLGHTVWRWSKGRLFTQTIQNKTVGASDTLTLEDEWNAQNAHGTYIAVATLNTAAHPIERRVAFTLP